METIAINDIRTPVRLTVKSRNQMMAIIRAAKNVKDAIEIQVKGTDITYYICEMTEFNHTARRLALRRAAYHLRKADPQELIDIIPDHQEKVPREFFCGMRG